MTVISKAYEGTFHDEAAIWLKWNNYEAAVLPNVGANLIAFRDPSRNLTILREPAAEEMNEFRANPGVHGIPVLFPPNRYDNGTFTFNGITYQLPVNEKETSNHLHGFFHTAKWNVVDFGVTKLESYVELNISVDENHSIYTYLPHQFTLTLRYTLNDDGLFQHIRVKNDGHAPMPCMIAFHTAINAPFDANSSKDDMVFTVTKGERWELNERMLPTGKYQAQDEEELKMATSGVSPYFRDMDNHYTATTKNGRNMMELTDNRTGRKVIYDVGTAYKQWMIWNNKSNGAFFCPEPQLNLVNAPNSTLPAEQIGLVTLDAQQIWEETSRLYIVEPN